MSYLASLRFLGSTLAVAATAVAIAQTTDPRDATPPPDMSYRAGTVPTTGPDANLPVPPRPPGKGGTDLIGGSGTAASSPGNGTAGSVPGRAPTVGGAGPLTTDNGVTATSSAGTRVAPTAASAASAPRVDQRRHHHRRPAHAAGAASATATKR